MLKIKWFQAALLAFAAMGLGLAPAGDAYAGSCSSNRSYDRGYDRSHGVSYHYRSGSHHNYGRRDYSYSRSRVSYHNDNVRFSVSLGSGRSYDRCRTYDYQPRYRSSSSCSKTVVYHAPAPTGYWKRVYHRPVYETRYDSCGRPYRVCVQAGYYERVWVETSRCR